MTNEKQMECRYLTPNIPKLRVKVLKVIELVIPDEKNEYVCALNSISQHEDTYKQENNPRYNAIDVAKKRCRTHNAVLLLASATPSIESYYYAQKGIYELLEMKKRYSGTVLPHVGIVDMNEERYDGNASEFSNILIDEINENLNNHEQTILLLNRRGYHTIISCCDCHKPVYCPNCSIPMTYHKINNTLMCHYCGHSQPPVESCPECGSTRLKQMGFGTQKLEEQLSKLFPQARILRMDADTTMSKYSYERNFKDFGQGKYDIMIGTQMIGKGLDFPNVTLVGVIAADSSLNIDDYRAHERTFQTLTQVAGRAGRGKDKGRVIIQTYNPDAFCIQYSQQQDYKLFYDTEIHLRKQLRYPPFCDIILIGVSSKSYKELEETSNKIYESLKAKIHTEKLQILLYKPVPAPIDRIKNKFRWRIIVKCIVGEPIINAIDDTVKNAGNKNTKNDTRIVVDVNPNNML